MPDVALGRARWTADEERHLATCTECRAVWAIVSAASRMGPRIPMTRTPEDIAGRVSSCCGPSGRRCGGPGAPGRPSDSPRRQRWCWCCGPSARMWAPARTSLAAAAPCRWPSPRVRRPGRPRASAPVRRRRPRRGARDPRARQPARGGVGLDSPRAGRAARQGGAAAMTHPWTTKGTSSSSGRSPDWRADATPSVPSSLAPAVGLLLLGAALVLSQEPGPGRPRAEELRRRIRRASRRSGSARSCSSATTRCSSSGRRWVATRAAGATWSGDQAAVRSALSAELKPGVAASARQRLPAHRRAGGAAGAVRRKLPRGAVRAVEVSRSGPAGRRPCCATGSWSIGRPGSSAAGGRCSSADGSLTPPR